VKPQEEKVDLDYFRIQCFAHSVCVDEEIERDVIHRLGLIYVIVQIPVLAETWDTTRILCCPFTLPRGGKHRLLLTWQTSHTHQELSFLI
jgi:hypothetical protein